MFVVVLLVITVRFIAEVRKPKQSEDAKPVGGKAAESKAKKPSDPESGEPCLSDHNLRRS